ncbi:MAG: SEC-C metal-binding domain-containing protein [Sporolactobacillus sp.]|uniref:Tetratricopeptide repeat-containing protein n=1 Tax=Sporolactobacillus nakayamae TaxID=269670 RepID=A0A1I2VGB9_9BACL|nr:tetratricopeptide repeat protein [Sporolactobacillus nakayamae]SFG87257.1 Tetratricopeptide repeat-containing protein [Sporolactobacillus nakayamae]
MPKIGRNDLCPCGSGKKYKKCCMDKDKQLMAKQIVRNPVNRFITYEEVNELSTDEIILMLRKFGIPFKQETFLKDIEKFYSAEDLTENWFHHYTVTARGRDEDFPWMAAWILWERLAPPKKLSMEQMGDLIDKGFEYVDENDSTSACDTWLTVWEGIKDRIEPEFQNLDYLDKHYKGSFFIKNFCQDLETELHNAGMDEPVYFEKRIKYCRDFCNYFPKENELIVHNMRRAIAESYAKLGQYEKAESEFEKLVQDFPNNPWGYIGWGDLFFFEQKKDYAKAQDLYEKGLAIAKDQMDSDAIKERLDELKEER